MSGPLTRARRSQAGGPTAVVAHSRPGVAAPGRGNTLPRRVLLTEYSAADLERVADRGRRGERVLPVLGDGALLVLGPRQERSAPTCLVCAEHTRATAAMGPDAPADHRRRGLIPPHFRGLLDDLIRHTDQAAPGAAWCLDGSRGTLSAHRTEPRHGGCARCHSLPDDTANQATTPRAMGVPVDPGSHRADPDRNSAPRLRRGLLDRRFGPVTHVDRGGRLSLAVSRALVADRLLHGEGGYGRATTFSGADDIAAYEALERIAGSTPGRCATILRDVSFADLGETIALDPTLLGRHEPAALAHPGFGLTHNPTTQPADWVWGHSFMRAGPLAVPEQAVYWGRPSAPGTGLLTESSNGCGLGASFEEAALFGLLEIIERDAFLLAWYARSPLPRIAVPAHDRLVTALAGRLEMLGYDLLLLDATSDLEVPVVAAVAVHRDPSSLAPQAFFAAAANFDPRAAIRGAVVELAVNVEHAPNLARTDPAAFDRTRLARLYANPTGIRSIGDHVGVNTLPQARERHAALLSGPSPQPWHARWPQLPERAPDAAVALAQLRQRAAGCGIDTIVVDQTPDWARDRFGLHAARIVAPGSISLIFGHLYRRTRDLPRLLSVPATLGRAPSALEYDLLPLDPHPFP